jgi:methyl-accepting chemotaxis protein
MLRNTKISTKIKFIGALLMSLMVVIISITIYLNQKNVKDALVINIAGKQRMLTQKISKNIFFLYHSDKAEFAELDDAIEEFIYNLDSLKNGNKLRGISSAPTSKIAEQLAKVTILWNSFYINTKEFKKELIARDNSNEKILKSYVDTIYNTNNTLLNEVDKLVGMYTLYAETKTNYIKNFQYLSAFILLLLIVYSLYELKRIELHAKEFLDYSKKLVNINNTDEFKPLVFEAECEIVEATDSLNCFVDKVNSAMQYSQEAILQSQQASHKLDELTEEFDEILNSIQNSSEISNDFNLSEDMMIESTEDLMNSAKKLENLKNQLSKLAENCKVVDEK